MRTVAPSPAAVPATGVDGHHRRGPLGAQGPLDGPPPLRRWSRTWRYLAAAGIAMVMWLAVSVDFIPPDDAPDDVVGRVGAALLLDMVLGVVALCLLPLRRRHPVLTATLTAFLCAVSASALGSAAVALVSAATWRRWQWVAPPLLMWGCVSVFYELVWRPAVVGGAVAPGFAALSGGFAMGMAATCVATGYYIGARRELLLSLRLRAETAEREQELKAETAREAERTRIAREMHDVLAHRISLVAMHAGALAYRTDLGREETAEAAGVIQRNAHLALTELRQVLGVLRAGDGGGQDAEPPQPLLAHVEELVEAALPHVDVSLDAAGLPGGTLQGASEVPATISRTAYRVVQEALTNACKHAPASTVVVRLAGAPDGLLTVEGRNDAPASPADPTRRAPGAGLGLVGLTERVALAGGALEHGAGPDGSFAVRAWLPWEKE